jgi:hypothetical protein
MRFTEFTVSDPSPGRVVPSRTKPCMNCSSPFLRSVSKKPSTNRPRGGSRADCNLRPLASQTPSGLPFCSAPSALLFLTLITRISGKGCEVWEAEETGVPTEVMDETKRSPSSDDFKGKVVSAQEPEGPPCHDRRPAGRHRPPDPQRGSWRTLTVTADHLLAETPGMVESHVLRSTRSPTDGKERDGDREPTPIWTSSSDGSLRRKKEPAP